MPNANPMQAPHRYIVQNSLWKKIIPTADTINMERPDIIIVFCGDPFFIFAVRKITAKETNGEIRLGL